MVTTTSSEQPLATAVDTYAPDWAWTADVGAAQRTDDELTKRITFIESGAIPDGMTPHETVAFKREMEAYYLRTNDRLLMHLSHDKGKPWRDLEAMIVVPNQLKSVIMRTYHESAMAVRSIHESLFKLCVFFKFSYLVAKMGVGHRHGHTSLYHFLVTKIRPPRVTG